MELNILDASCVVAVLQEAADKKVILDASCVVAVLQEAADKKVKAEQVKHLHAFVT